ncbi:nitrous oxide-stimulated promoter family protein [Alkaliphilus peptidifermentans]|uniref:Nitrous oxide-stimulated promoter n=1 Tax=Alkaliphilus peptidifermentans DSM 18978 TaxID=1120976 RepID=A0A1G5EYJ7_9FIRM|nr:nitrous oxide-stimulated promoter family protein [Alkaliphilus peptidifermentans]SCY31984.1 Nitrous oxide-stimulated promoter [Alkaliphilus peptidifermentans DSM 18978]
MINLEEKRLRREKLTIEKMIGIYCRRNHQRELCIECKALLEYAINKLRVCPFKERKPVCASCRIHCYVGEMKDNIKGVMRYSGPKMLLLYPIDTLAHILHTGLLWIFSSKKTND